MSMKQELRVFIFKVLPKSLMSRLFGYLARVPLPGWLLNSIIAWYSKKYGVLVSEMRRPALGFRTFNEFFTRKLKDKARDIDAGKGSVVSPVDARLDSFGDIRGDAVMQAKGIDYPLAGLVPSDTHREFLNGTFMTLYLSPGDYHRIHSPVDGEITGFFRIPGRLYTVQEFMVKGLRGLFALNERLITYVKTERGLVAVCKIGAMNVGRITASYENRVQTNTWIRTRREHLYDEHSRIRVSRGDELGIFNLGSTVILLFQEGMVRLDPLSAGDSVRMGQRIGVLADGKTRQKKRGKS